jgi:hypothetical protein
MIEYHELEKVLHTLPPAAQEELLSFVNYLQYKHQHDQAGTIVKLGGLWTNVNLDVSDQDVRALRRQLTSQLADGI